MNKNIGRIIAAIGLLTGLQQTGIAAGGKGCSIIGEIKGAPANAPVLLLRRVGEFGLDTIATASTNENGRFQLNVPEKELLELYELRITGARYSCSIVAEDGQININGDHSKLYQANVDGTAENVRYSAWQKFVAELSLERNNWIKSGKSTKDEEYIRLNNILDKKQREYSDSLIRNFPNSIVSLYLAKQPLLMMNYKQIDSILEKFEPHFASHKYFMEMKERADVLRKVAPGAIAPAIKALKADGQTSITLEGLRGKYVMLDFWASWCAPCRVENKHTSELYEKFHPKGLEVLSFSLDSDLSAWQKAIEKDGMPWHHASDLVGGKNSPIAKTYGIEGLPAIWLIDPQGRIVAEGIRGQALEKILEGIFHTN